MPAIGYFRFGMDPILAFWFAYVVTRPLGASFADWLAVSHARGGLALGTGPVSLVLAVLIAGFVAYLASSRIDVAAPESAPAVDCTADRPAKRPGQRPDHPDRRNDPPGGTRRSQTGGGGDGGQGARGQEPVVADHKLVQRTRHTRDRERHAPAPGGAPAGSTDGPTASQRASSHAPMP